MKYNKIIECKYLFCLFFGFVVICRKSVSGTTSQAQSTDFVNEILKLSKAAEMRSYMNIDENPCFDFYQYSCGNWKKINPATGLNGKTQTLALDEIRNSYNRKLLKLLGQVQPESSTDSISDEKLKIFFLSCMEAETNRSQLIQLLSQYGSMPALEGNAWNEESFDWMESLTSIKRDFALQVLIGLDVGADLRQGTMNRIFIGQPALRFPNKSFYTEKSGLKYRLAYRAEIANDLQNAFEIRADIAWQVAEEIVGFEILLSDGLPPSDKTDSLNAENLIVETTIDELQKMYAPTVDFKEFFNKILGEIPKGPIYVFVESYMKNLKYVLESTNHRLLANYISYMFLKEFLLPPTMNSEQKKKSQCLHKVQQHFAESLENMSYRRVNNIAAIESDLKIIWTALRTSFKSHLFSKSLEWMTPTVREYAASKLNALSLKINSYEKEEEVPTRFEDLDIKTYDFVGNIMQILMHSTKNIFKKINTPTRTEENSGYYYSTIIPFTMYEENTIKIPVILLQPYLLWASNYPMSVKFSTLGFLIARELIHSFDDKGRLYNKEGKLSNWWDEATTNAFMVDRECFIEQYPQGYERNYHSSSYIDQQSENIADNGGLKLAYNAFTAWKNNRILENPPQFSGNLLNFNATDEEIFFLSFAQLWCNDVYPSDKNFLANRDHHMPGQFRVNGALSNSIEFSKSYRCDDDSPMSPAVYCALF